MFTDQYFIMYSVCFKYYLLKISTLLFVLLLFSFIVQGTTDVS